MPKEAAVGTVADAAGKRVGGELVSRPKALLASAVVALAAAVVTYKLLRSGGGS